MVTAKTTADDGEYIIQFENYWITGIKLDIMVRCAVNDVLIPHTYFYC